MINKVLSLPVLAILLLFASCAKKDYRKVAHDPVLFIQTVKKLNDIVLENNFPPVVASRNYAYASVAAYEVIAAGNSAKYHSLAGKIKHLKRVPLPAPGVEIDYPFASLIAFCRVGNAVTFPEGSMDAYVKTLEDTVRQAGMPSSMVRASVEYGSQVAQHILSWSKQDGYAQTRSATKYTVTTEDGRWIPTPPMYSQALEPHWSEIRPFVLDSASQFLSAPPPPFNMRDKNSPFCRNVMEVKLIGDKLTEEQKEIADFWDDNPFKLNISGHVQFATKKFSPPGHWMNIVGIACQLKKSDFNETTRIYALSSIALFDGFINCWYEKFKWNYVRPETVINKYLDSDWKPYIQTPPFPEYTSGHAVISAAAAEVLTACVGDQVAFRDSSQLEFGLPPRTFRSFREAALEAGRSRVYGGIHYVNSCQVGTEIGKEVGSLVVRKLFADNRKMSQIAAKENTPALK